MSNSNGTKIRVARDGDLQQVTAMLQTEGLPIDDLSASHLAFVAECDGAILGAIGRQYYGDVGLLRSLVVAERARGRGVACALITALEADARAASVQELWLLTLDQQAYFEARDFAVRPRSEAPPDIKSTEEFSGLCPGDATLMSKSLC